MVHRIRDLKKALDEQADGQHGANFIAIGDFNTLGMDVTYYDPDVAEADEIERYERVFGARDLKRLSKSHEYTWWNGTDSSYEPSNLDHAFASEHLDFETLDNGAELTVKGWPEESGDAAKTDWIERYSDDALLYGVVTK